MWCHFCLFSSKQFFFSLEKPFYWPAVGFYISFRTNLKKLNTISNRPEMMSLWRDSVWEQLYYSHGFLVQSTKMSLLQCVRNCINGISLNLEKHRLVEGKLFKIPVKHSPREFKIIPRSKCTLLRFLQFFLFIYFLKKSFFDVKLEAKITPFNVQSRAGYTPKS